MLLLRRKYKKIENYFHESNHFDRADLVPVLVILVIAAIFGVLAAGSSAFALRQKEKNEKKEKQALRSQELKQLGLITTKLESIPDETIGWKTYANEDYGFEIKYPSEWSEPEGEGPSGSSPDFNYKISFRNKNSDTLEKFSGFDILIFRESDLSGSKGAGILSQKAGADDIDSALCGKSASAQIGVGGYPAKEFDIPTNDPCYQQIFFYSLARNGYTYQLVPIEKKDYIYTGYIQKGDVTRNFPKFYRIVSTLKFDGSSLRQSAAATLSGVKKKVSPPRVFVAKARCAHKNDHPRKSKKGKGRHMDEDCCMDPDEWPNPRCAY